MGFGPCNSYGTALNNCREELKLLFAFVLITVFYVSDILLSVLVTHDFSRYSST